MMNTSFNSTRFRYNPYYHLINKNFSGLSIPLGSDITQQERINGRNNITLSIPLGSDITNGRLGKPRSSFLLSIPLGSDITQNPPYFQSIFHIRFQFH